MKRNFIVVCVSALALALGLSASAGAGILAEDSAKPAKKGKSCKKKGSKGKAGKSAAATAQAKKKGKGKSCKGKRTDQDKGQANPAPPAPAPAPVPPPVSWPPADGVYDDPGPNSVTLTIKNAGTLATVEFSGPSTCFPIAVGTAEGPVTSTPSSLKASAEFSGGGGAIKGKWSVTVVPGLGYELITDSSLEFPEQKPCNKPGVVFTGTLLKKS